MTTIANALFTKSQQKIIGLLFRRPDRSHYLNEIVRIADMGKGTIKRELEKMTSSGLLTIKKIGNQNHYQANPLSPIFNELVAISRKTFGIADIIRNALNSYESHIKFAFVYGSVAKQTDTVASDLDLVIVGDDLVYAQIMELLASVEKELQRTINPSLYSAEDFKKKYEQGNSFITRILQQEKIMIIGDENVIG